MQLKSREPKRHPFFLSSNQLPSVNQVTQAFTGLKFERSPRGGLKIEAEGESAAILANIFQGMANLFSSMPK